MNRHDEPIVRLPPFSVAATYTALAETVDWGLAAYNVPRHWADTRGRGVRVAVLDTGIAAEHLDLNDAVDDARDFTTGKSAADRSGHGTHVAGTIAARQNSIGVIGVAPECRLLIAKVLDDDGSGSAEQVAAGIDWAIEAGADVLSMSFGSSDSSREISRAIDRAIASGRFVVCAAGNSGRNDSVDYPARLRTTIAVGSVDQNGQVSRFSSRGDQVDLCAPGENILSTYLNGGYAKMSGTSMAAPFVTGIVALLLSKHRARGGQTRVDSQQQLLEHLRRTATDAGPQGKDPAYGYGLIHPDSVLESRDAAPEPAVEISGVRVDGVEGVLVFQPK